MMWLDFWLIDTSIYRGGQNKIIPELQSSPEAKYELYDG